MLDYIPNHSSDKHPWFIKSRLGGADNPYADYYVWHDGIVRVDGKRVPPTEWASEYNFSCILKLFIRKIKIFKIS